MARTLMLIAIVLAVVTPAAAQTQVAVGGSLFLDLKRFSGDPATRPYDGEAIGGGVRLAVNVSPRWGFEVDVDLSRTTAVTTPQSISILSYISTGYTSSGSLPPGVTLPPGVSLPGPVLPPGLTVPSLAFETRTTSGLTSASALVAYRVSGSGRVHPGVVGGLTFMRVTRATEYPNLLAATAGLPSIIRPLLPTSIFPRQTERIDYAPAATAGVEVALDVTNHLAVVPELRAHAFSAGGSGVFAIRPGIAVRWTF